MMNKIEEVKVLTVREMIEGERQRLIKGIDSEWWKSPHRSDWARNQFGQNLTEKTAEEIYEGLKETYRVDKYAMMASEYIVCRNCGKLLGLDEKFLYLEFSFCDEYACSMTLCKKCLRDFTKKVK